MSPARRAERHAHAELAPALLHRLRHERVEPQRGERQRQRREHPQQPRARAGAPRRLVEPLIHRLDVGEREIGIERLDVAPQGRDQRLGRGPAPDEDEAGGSPRLQERQVDVRAHGGLDRAVADVGGDANDLRAVMEPALSDADALADWIAVSPEGPRCRLADHHDLRLPDPIAVGEGSSADQPDAERFEVSRRCPENADQRPPAWRRGRPVRKRGRLSRCTRRIPARSCRTRPRRCWRGRPAVRPDRRGTASRAGRCTAGREARPGR